MAIVIFKLGAAINLVGVLVLVGSHVFYDDYCQPRKFGSKQWGLKNAASVEDLHNHLRVTSVCLTVGSIVALVGLSSM